VLGRGDYGGDRLAKVVGDSVAIWQGRPIQNRGRSLLADQRADAKDQAGC
jgi:hypothetical protein